MYTPAYFFVTHGEGYSNVSPLNAFDHALINAGISEQNLVSVSSVLPVGINEVKQRIVSVGHGCQIPMGAITHCVLSRCESFQGTASAGIAYAFRKDGIGGYVAEGHCHEDEKELKIQLIEKMKDMWDVRGLEPLAEGDIKTVIQTARAGHGEYCCAVSSLVFMD